MKNKNTMARWGYLTTGTLCLLATGIIYAWSILKVPLGPALEMSDAELSLNFTITMSFFCIGGMAGSFLSGRFGCRLPLFAAALLSGSGLALTSLLSAEFAQALYCTYGMISGFGIGIAYNVVIASVTAWFPDKKGLSSGCLMMSFGASTLLLGSIVGSMIHSPAIGWRSTYLAVGVLLEIVLLFAGFILQTPPRHPRAASAPKGSLSYADDLTTGQMIRRSSFWRAFICIVFMASLGNSVISFAYDISVSIGMTAQLATAMVGVLSVCNGAGRILTGLACDALGRRKAMLAANCLVAAAAAVMLYATFSHSQPMLITGFCLVGLSYGTCPPISSVFTLEFYGTRHFSSNFSFMNFNLMGASLIATVSGVLINSFESYIPPLMLLMVLAVVAIFFNISIRKP